MHVYVYACVSLHVHVCICLYTYVCRCIYTYMYVCISMQLYVYMHKYSYVSISICICMCAHVYVCTCKHMCVSICMCVCVYICVCPQSNCRIHTNRKQVPAAASLEHALQGRSVTLCWSHFQVPTLPSPGPPSAPPYRWLLLHGFLFGWKPLGPPPASLATSGDCRRTGRAMP